MDKKYVFSSAGVAQWQQDLSAGSSTERLAEAALAGEGLEVFLPERFTLSSEQVAYLDGLDPALLQLWAAQLVYAITARIPIELEKPTGMGDVEELNTKFIESEDRTGTGQGTTLSEDEERYYLRFIVGY